MLWGVLWGICYRFQKGVPRTPRTALGVPDLTFTLSVINVDAVHSIEPYMACWTFSLFLNQPFSDLIVSLEGLKKGLSVL